MYCPKCGNVVNYEGKFCGNCGAVMHLQKKKSSLLKRAWFAPISIISCLIIQLVISKPVRDVLSALFDFEDYFYAFFENMTEFQKSVYASSLELEMYEIITVFFQELIALPCILIIYLIVFAKIDKKIKSKINLVLLIPYTLHILSNIIPSAISEIGMIMYNLEVFDAQDLSSISSMFGIACTILASIVSYFWCKHYLEKFEEKE